jgi:nitroimidazol reductase NimA-like FMN-containing flavoprotein (pyridoxamine 5'-phosphate oxidase superfamily)
VRETAADLAHLQALLDDSIAVASPFLRRSFEMPEHSLSAQQLAVHLQGSLTVALATVTRRAEPRVAPINALFFRGSFHVPTVAESARVRNVARRPAVSLSYLEGTALAVIVHGRATTIDANQPGFTALDELQVASGAESPTSWDGSPVYLKVEAATLFTYARHPDRHPPALH